MVHPIFPAKQILAAQIVVARGFRLPPRIVKGRLARAPFEKPHDHGVYISPFSPYLCNQLSFYRTHM